MGTLAVPLLAMMIDMFKASCCPRVGQEKAFCVTIAIMVIMCSVIMCVCGHAPLMPFLYLKRTMHTILLRTRLPDVFELSVLSVFSPGQQPRTFDQIS